MQDDNKLIGTLTSRIENGKADVARRVDTYSDGKFSMTVGSMTASSRTFTEKKDAGIALMAAATEKATEDGYTTIGQFAGFDLRVVKTYEGIKGLVSGNQAYSFNTYPGNLPYMINHIIATVQGIDGVVTDCTERLAETRKDIELQEKLIDEPFEKQSELDAKRKRYNEVMEVLNPKQEQSLSSMDEDTEQEQSREYLESEAASFR